MKTFEETLRDSKKVIKTTIQETVVQDIDFDALLKDHKNDEGLVIFGAGGDLQKWIDGIVEMWQGEDIFKGTPDEAFTHAYKIQKNDSTSLVLIFNPAAKFTMGKMAMWRLRFGNASWLSDYFVNYNPHSSDDSIEDEEEDNEDDMEESLKRIVEAKDVTIYKALIQILGDYSKSYGMTGVARLFQKAVDNGVKILPKDKAALDIIQSIVMVDSSSGAVQQLLNTRFSTLPIHVCPIAKVGRAKETAFWNSNGKFGDKVLDLINFDGKAAGYWSDVRGNKVSLVDKNIDPDIAG